MRSGTSASPSCRPAENVIRILLSYLTVNDFSAGAVLQMNVQPFRMLAWLRTAPLKGHTDFLYGKSDSRALAKMQILLPINADTGLIYYANNLDK